MLHYSTATDFEVFQIGGTSHHRRSDEKTFLSKHVWSFLNPQKTIASRRTFFPQWSDRINLVFDDYHNYSAASPSCSLALQVNICSSASIGCLFLALASPTSGLISHVVAQFTGVFCLKNHASYQAAFSLVAASNAQKDTISQNRVFLVAPYGLEVLTYSIDLKRKCRSMGAGANGEAEGCRIIERDHNFTWNMRNRWRG